MTIDDTERLRAFQALGYAKYLEDRFHTDLWKNTVRPDPALNDAYARGLAGEPPPCGCEAQERLDAMLEYLSSLEADQRGWLAVAAHTTILIDTIGKLRLLLGDDVWRTVEPCRAIEVLRECERRLRADLDDGATYTMSQVIRAQMEALRTARAALGDTEAVE